MAITKEKKKKIVEDLREKISKQNLTVFIDFSKIKTKELNELRSKLRESFCLLKVIKKNLAQIAFKNAGFKIDFKKIKAQLALVFGFKDEILPAKIVYQFSQKNPNLKILGGIFEKKFVEPEKIIELAKLPTRDELLGRLVQDLFSPVSNLTNVLKGNLKNLISILSKLKVNQ